jgi:Ca-activated chloride channel family protein
MDWLNPTYLAALSTIPAVILLMAWAAMSRKSAYKRLGDPVLIEKLASAISPRRRRWKSGLLICAVTLLAVALAGPRFGTKLREVKREGVDIIFALDVSLSMQAGDIAPNRLDRSKNELKKLLDELRGWCCSPETPSFSVH